MFKKISGITLLVMSYGLLVMSCFAQEEQITITTYYPSPYGSYNELYVASKLGIGRTDPFAALHVKHSGYNTVFQSDNVNDTVDLQFYDGDDTVGNYKWDLTYRGNAQGNDLQLYKAGGGDPIMVWDYAIGNVGIGTTNPVAPLDVQTVYGGSNGMVRIGETQIWDNEINRYSLKPDGTPTTAGTALLIQYRNPSFSNADQARANAGDTLINSYNGNVGIGMGSGTIHSPAPNGNEGNLDVNDVYLRSIGRWASQFRDTSRPVYQCPNRGRSDCGGCPARDISFSSTCPYWNDSGCNSTLTATCVLVGYLVGP